MKINALLCAYENSYVEVKNDDADTSSRSEGYIELGGVKVKKEAQLLGNALLKVRSKVVKTVVVAGIPFDVGVLEDFAFSEGDKISVPGTDAQRVKSVSVSFSGDTATVVPELESLLAIEAAKVQRTLDRWANGDGGSEMSGKTLPGKGDERVNRIYELPPYSLDGLLSSFEDKTSPPYIPARPMLLTAVVLGLAEAGVTDTVVEMLIDDSVAATLLLEKGRRIAYFSILKTLLDPTISVQYRIKTGGAGARGLTVQTRANLT